ncbi:hypothetical protein K501DRAFT_278303 [Backusella circina FSU 941]|nr:hypothetical protein K501DRAFT_278303 [Backusella circina FSU 941]
MNKTFMRSYSRYLFSVKAESQSSAAVFVLPDTGEIYSSNNYGELIDNDWTDILYKEKKLDRQEYMEYEESLKRMNNIHALLSGYSENRKIPITFLSPSEYLNGDMEKIEQYIQYDLNNNEDQDDSDGFLPKDMHHTELNYEHLDDAFIEDLLDEEVPEYGYGSANQKSVGMNTNNLLHNQSNNNGKILGESKQPEINTDNITPPNHIEENWQPSINEENNNIDSSYSFNPGLRSFTPSVETFERPPNKNRPADASNIDDYHDDLSPDEMAILDKILEQKDVQQAMLQKGVMSDTNLKSILYSVYDSTNNDSLHSLNENEVNFEKENRVSISTSGDSNLTIPENQPFKSNVNSVPHASSIPKKNIFETNNHTSPLDGLDSKSRDIVETEVVENQFFDTNDDEKRFQQYDTIEAVKSKGGLYQIENIPNRSIHSIPSIYSSKPSQIEYSREYDRAPTLSTFENAAISKSGNPLPIIASVTSVPKIKTMENTSFVSSYTPGSYPTESLTILNVDLELENPSNDTLEPGLLQSGNLENNTLKTVTLQQGISKTFDPSVQIKNPNGSWSPSCKSVRKGMYCMDLDGVSSTVVECFGENIGFQFSCGDSLFCYTVSAYDVDCRARL